MYYDGPFHVFGLPEEVISDRGPQFRADFTDELSRILGVKWKLSSAKHSQTAGQAKIINAYIDQRLRPYINHYQDNWSNYLPALDAVQANLPHDSTGLSPHKVSRGFPINLPFNWTKRTKLSNPNLSRPKRLNQEEAQQVASRIRKYVGAAKSAVEAANNRYAVQANKHHQQPDFKPGDRVFIIKKT